MAIFKKKKSNEQQQNNSYQDNTSKQIAFFGFYLVFFVVIIILLRTSYKSIGTKETKKLNGYGYDYKLTSLTNNNYHFVYKENLNDNEIIYEGDTLNSVTSLTKSGEVATNYYLTGDKVYLKDNNLLTWSETTNPMMFKDFISTLNIQSIINESEYVYKSEYIKENFLYFGYSITNNKLRKVFKQNEVEGDTLTNNIIVVTDKNGTIKSVNYELTNYYKSIDQNINKYILNINYSKFNEIKEITNPIN